MSGRPVILAVDAGTGDCRAIVFSTEGRVLASAHMEWTYESGAGTVPNAFAFQPEACWDDVMGLIGRAAAQLRDCTVMAVTVTSQRDGMAFLDRDGRELYCAPNMDLRGGAVLEELEPHKEEILQRTGLPLHALFGLPRLLWHKRCAPELYERIDCVLMLCDWLAFRLCGEKRSERAAASSSQMLNLASGEYDCELMEHLGLRSDIFPKACAGTEPVGALRQEVAERAGLPAGIPVFIGGSDTHCGIVGMGCLHPGETAVVAGTTTPVVSLFDRPVTDAEAAVYGGCTSVPGQWALESNADSTGLSLRWVRDIFYPGRTDAFDEMTAQAASVPPGCGGMSAYIGVGIRGEDRGKNYGGFVFPVPWNVSDYTRGHFFRAALETNAFGVCANLEVLRRKGAAAPKLLHLCGGQSRSALWAQILADTAGIPVQTYENPESTALGAAMQAAVGAGVYCSLEEAAAVFARKKAAFIPDADTPYPEIYADWLRLHRHLIAF